MELLEVIESSPAIVVNCRSSTVATEEAMVAGSAPARLALTLRVGKSTAGRSLTGSVKYATTPNSAMAAINRLVAIGRRMKISERFTCARSLTGTSLAGVRPPLRRGLRCPGPCFRTATATAFGHHCLWIDAIQVRQIRIHSKRKSRGPAEVNRYSNRMVQPCLSVCAYGA